ncbi:MAG: ribulose-phosphate 3-epimerase [Trueperaceae bacterium]|nr:ribulose-phosphate 3-epimerase [Trueperaceae bacterium]
MKPDVKLAPSILAADFTRLGQEISEAEAAGAHLLHIDIMDGCFVPNISFGALMIDACRKASGLYRDVHLMIEKPERYTNDFVEAGANNLTIHAEATNHVHRVLEQIKEHGVDTGLAVNPVTPLSYVKEALPYLDKVLIMTVNPGFGGQKFIETCLDRVKEVARWREKTGLEFDIQVDGGIDETTIERVIQAGANNLVAGSAIFGQSAGITERFQLLNSLALQASEG